MKTDTHPQYTTTHVHCTSCGVDFDTRSTGGDSITVDVCSNCHPFYTGKQRILDSGGRVQRFRNRQQARQNR